MAHRCSELMASVAATMAVLCVACLSIFAEAAPDNGEDAPGQPQTPQAAAEERENAPDQTQADGDAEDHAQAGKTEADVDSPNELDLDEVLVSVDTAFRAEKRVIEANGRSTSGEESAKSAPGIFAEALAYAQKRCVRIYGAGIALEHGYATGMIVSDDGLILTAFGLYVTGARVQVMLPDGSIHEAEPVRRSDRIRCVLLKIQAKTPDFFEIPDTTSVNRGDWVLGVANPYKVADVGEDLSVNMGVVSLRAEIDTKKRSQDMDIGCDILLIDAITSNPGSPGGALMTSDGQVAGMIGKIMDSQSTNTRINYAIPSDILRQFIDGTLVEDPDEALAAMGKAVTGIRVFRLAGKNAAAYVDRVKRRSPAAAAGLRRDDLILAIGEEIIRDVKDFDAAVERLVPGREVTVLYKRREQILTAKLTPEAEQEDEDE